MNKKFLGLVCVMVLFAIALTGCLNSNNNDDEDNPEGLRLQIVSDKNEVEIDGVVTISIKLFNDYKEPVFILPFDLTP